MSRNVPDGTVASFCLRLVSARGDARSTQTRAQSALLRQYESSIVSANDQDRISVEGICEVWSRREDGGLNAGGA